MSLAVPGAYAEGERRTPPPLNANLTKIDKREKKKEKWANRGNLPKSSYAIYTWVKSDEFSRGPNFFEVCNFPKINPAYAPGQSQSKKLNNLFTYSDLIYVHLYNWKACTSCTLNRRSVQGQCRKSQVQEFSFFRWQVYLTSIMPYYWHKIFKEKMINYVRNEDMYVVGTGEVGPGCRCALVRVGIWKKKSISSWLENWFLSFVIVCLSSSSGTCRHACDSLISCDLVFMLQNPSWNQTVLVTFTTMIVHKIFLIPTNSMETTWFVHSYENKTISVH